MEQMIIIDNVYVSEELIKEKFVCALDKCKGGCCVDGDAGAPLNHDELAKIEEVFPVVKKYLSAEALAEIERVGLYTKDVDFDMVTPDINGGVCVYGFTDERGIVKCAIEKAYNAGEVTWKKPISCHLFPIRIGKKGIFESLNYEPREDLCAPACANGSALNVPVYKFLQEPITRKYGADFFDALDQIATEKYKK
jgi:Protein of unknown function (DUF3109)